MRICMMSQIDTHNMRFLPSELKGNESNMMPAYQQSSLYQELENQIMGYKTSSLHHRLANTPSALHCSRTWAVGHESLTLAMHEGCVVSPWYESSLYLRT
jgi:hypothetical protein